MLDGRAMIKVGRGEDYMIEPEDRLMYRIAQLQEWQTMLNKAVAVGQSEETIKLVCEVVDEIQKVEDELNERLNQRRLPSDG